MRQKKAQAAMEFLMTYGWAILAAVIVIAVLASLGVFSPESSVPNACTIAAPFGCDQNQVTASVSSDNLTLVLRNGGGQDYAITAVALDGCTVGTATLGGVTLGATNVINDQATANLVISCSNNELGTQVGDKFTGGLTLSYTVSGGTLSQQASGNIVVTLAA